MQDIELLPCPECGGQPKLNSLEPEHQSMKYFCSVHVSCGDWKETEELAATDWNRRVQEYQIALQKIKTPDINVWRYQIPPLDGQGWGIFLLDSTGMFAAVTDYGNCAYKWTHHGRSDFREFIAKVKPDYLNDYYIIKLFGHRDVFDGEETLKEIKRHILTYRYENQYTKDYARKEWDLLEDYYDDSEFGFGRWLEETNISDAYEFAVYDYSASAKAFGSELLPRLAEVIRQDIGKED